MNGTVQILSRSDYEYTVRTTYMKLWKQTPQGISLKNLNPPSSILQPLHLHHRPGIKLPGPEHIIQHAETQHEPRNQHAIIHRRGRRWRGGGPETEEEEDEEVDACEGVVCDAEGAGDVPGTPGYVRRGGEGGMGIDIDIGLSGGLVMVVGGGGGMYGAGDAAVEEEGADEEVGGVEGADDEGDDVVEGSGGADVYEDEEAGVYG